MCSMVVARKEKHESLSNFLYLKEGLKHSEYTNFVIK